MKQQGATWITADGKETLKKFIPPHIQLHEKLAQKIASIAVHMEENLRQTRVTLVNACREALRNNPDKSMKTRFTYTSFDNEYKVEFDLQTEHVRIYQATKKNPGSKDYRLVDLNITSVKSELGTWDDYIKGIDVHTSAESEGGSTKVEPKSTAEENAVGIDNETVAMYEHSGKEIDDASLPVPEFDTDKIKPEPAPVTIEERHGSLQKAVGKVMPTTTVEDFISPEQLEEAKEVFKDPDPTQETPGLFE